MIKIALQNILRSVHISLDDFIDKTSVYSSTISCHSLLYIGQACIVITPKKKKEKKKEFANKKTWLLYIHFFLS
jgi:hypothetical protein